MLFRHEHFDLNLNFMKEEETFINMSHESIEGQVLIERAEVIANARRAL